VYEIIIILCLVVIFAILWRKWPKTRLVEVNSSSQINNLEENFLDQAETLFKNNNLKEAEKYFLKAAASDPDNPFIYGRLGIIYFGQDNLKDAKEAFKMALRLDPENGFYQNNLGLVLYKMGRYKEALLYFENAVDLDPQMSKRWLNLGLCLDKLGNFKRAKEAYQKARELEPENKKYIELIKKMDIKYGARE
jgi:Tfp pilus assembly protein PilF